MIDFRKNCSVMFFFEKYDGEATMMHYERPQYVDDYTLTEAARSNAEDMLKKELNGARELITIGIARSEIQYQDIMNKVQKGAF